MQNLSKIPSAWRDFFGFPSIEDSQYIPSPDEKDFYTPEEAYELVMSDVRSEYIMQGCRISIKNDTI